MNPVIACPLAAALLLALSAPATAAVTVAKAGDHTISFEGLLQGDANWYDSDRSDLGDDRVGRIRRAELIVKGAGGGPLDWVVGWDAKAEKFLDVNLRGRWDSGDYKHSLQAGQFKQPNSLEELSSTRNNDFISKAGVTNTFVVGRRLGVGYSVRRGPVSLTASVFGDELTSGQAEGAGWAARGTWAPIHADGRTLHLGVNHARHDVAAQTLRLRARPQADLTDARLVDTGRLPATHQLGITGLEAMWIDGPLKLQGEYVRAHGQRHGLSDIRGNGSYASVMYTLGGHAWKYDNGVPSMPKADEVAGGIWQLGARIDQLDLDDGAVRGGAMQTLTLGVNWYVTPYAKLALNWVKVDSERYNAAAGAVLADDPTITELRAQFHW